jgi:hypothetical protein
MLFCMGYTSSLKHHTEHHTQDQTQYRRPTVKEHYRHWDSQQDFNSLKDFINLKKSNLTILSTTRHHIPEDYTLFRT